jgi:hypothetical protein
VRLNPPRAPLFPEPHSFFWLPIAGQRHAANIRDRDLPYGELIDTLWTTTKAGTSSRARVAMAHLLRLLDHHRGVRRTAGLNRSHHG